MHPVTGPAVQRAQRVLATWVRPAIVSGSSPFEVEATDEHFEPLAPAAAMAHPVAPFPVGAPWGRAWHTRWFRLRGAVPPSAGHHPLVAHIDLGFGGRYDGFQAEGLVYEGGRVVHAVQPDRRLVHLGQRPAGSLVELWVEAAANPNLVGTGASFEATPFGDPATAPDTPLYVLRRAELGRFEPEVDQLAVELHAVIDLAIALPAEAPQRARVFVALEECLAALCRDDVVGTASAARQALAPVFAVPAAPGSHRIVATGHAHLDTAWLWPLREARRKALRTFSNAVHLLRRHPDHHVTHSQAQHYAWVAEDAPELFAEVQALVAEGRWEPAGGMWVETDLNLPAGESLVRQFLHGQRAFTEWFGRPCSGAFLPDDFGYPASLPQLVLQGGGSWFFTQKLSWNETNRFPHHTFWWEGLDGSRVLTHFSPADTYNALLCPGELRAAAQRFAEHAGASSSLVCFGHGDGGGGATDAMIQRARLAADWEGVPPVRLGSVEGFFAETRAEYGARAPVWVGELYLEKHRGTSSTQVRTKQGNRRCEQLLHEVELWSATRGLWPTEPLSSMWREVLTQQFHDILPGSSIAWVHADAEAAHARVADQAEALVQAALRPEGEGDWVLNPAPVPVRGVIDVAGDAVWAEVEAFGAALLQRTAAPPAGVSPVRVGERSIDNGRVRVAWDDLGRMVSLVHVATGREVLPPGAVAAELHLRRDHPADYDAWEVDELDARLPAEVLVPEEVQVVEAGRLRAVIEARYRTARSSFVVRTSVVAGSTRIDHELDADWHEHERRLQVVLPVDVHAREATCGIQFGHVRRPRHANTSWDAAKFEVCAHRYVHVGEPGFGVAILADGPRGYDVRGDALRLTVLRAPRYPDPGADRGPQRVRWSTWVHDGDPFVAGLEHESHRLAHPTRVVTGRPAVTEPLVRCEVPGVLVSAVKRAEDGSGDLVVRLWETRGGRSAGRLLVRGGVTAAVVCDGLEAPTSELAPDADGAVPIALRPFEILTMRVR